MHFTNSIELCHTAPPKGHAAAREYRSTSNEFRKHKQALLKLNELFEKASRNRIPFDQAYELIRNSEKPDLMVRLGKLMVDENTQVAHNLFSSAADLNYKEGYIHLAKLYESDYCDDWWTRYISLKEKPFLDDSKAIDLYTKAGELSEVARVQLKPLYRTFKENTPYPRNYVYEVDDYKFWPSIKQKYMESFGNVISMLRVAGQEFFEKPVTQESFDRFQNKIDTIIKQTEETFKEEHQFLRDYLKPFFKTIIGIIFLIPAHVTIFVLGLKEKMMGGDSEVVAETMGYYQDQYRDTFFVTDNAAKAKARAKLGEVEKKLKGNHDEIQSEIDKTKKPG